ncbi:MAG: S8 family serine peptidase, partial [bacterium]|nr:S8 family serine peptidase [bacterium]
SYREEYSYIYGTYYSSNERISKDLFAQPYDGKTDGMAVFSSKGPLTDGRISPMIVAPGTGIHSTSAVAKNAYEIENGTSMATPQVAASAAVLRQYLKEYHEIQRPTAAVMRAGLILCADSLYPGQYGSSSPEVPNTSPNNAEGWGAVRLGKHLAGIASDGTKGSPQTLGFMDRISLKNTSDVVSFSFITTAKDDIRVVLSWIDYYSVADKTQPLCNDYDLEITHPNGEIYTLNDHLNPIERIIIEDAPIGEYTVTIKCSRMSNTGDGNIAAVAWSATTGTEAKTFDVPTVSNTTYNLTVKLPEDVTAYSDYPIWPAPGTHTFGADESFSPIAGPKLSYTLGEHGVTHLAGWILFDAEGNPIQQHFPKHEDVICYSTKKVFSGVTQVLEKPIILSSDNCTLQWYATFPGYGIRLK